VDFAFGTFHSDKQPENLCMTCLVPVMQLRYWLHQNSLHSIHNH